MKEMFNFIIGSLYTIIILFVGGSIGYLIGSRRLEETIDKFKRKYSKPSADSGRIKVISPVEKREEASGETGVKNKIGELLK